MKHLCHLIFLIAWALVLPAQVTYERILNAKNEPQNWLTYSGTYTSQRYSTLDQITRDNVQKLDLAWVYQAQTNEKFELTPIVADGVMYITAPPNDVVALDARTGRVFWTYQHNLPTRLALCCGRVNRGLAILNDTLYLATLDGHLLAIGTRTGKVIWDVDVVDYREGYSFTAAPLVVKDKVITGPAGAEYGIKGFLEAFDAKTGESAWRFETVPGPGEPGHETWEGDSWKTGGGAIWLTGSFDPELNLLYWGIANPGPVWNGDDREGDNLYSASVVALDVDTGELKWYFQFTPHDVWDWDAAQIGVLADGEFGGRERKLLLWGNRNGFYYVLDRVTGEFLRGEAFVQQTWAEGLDAKGRPILKLDSIPTREGTVVSPTGMGATNWYSPTYSPNTGLFYVTVWEAAGRYRKADAVYRKGSLFHGGTVQRIRSADSYGAVRALDAKTGKKVWDFKLGTLSQSGLLSTAGDVVFTGTALGFLIALDARSGEALWMMNLGGSAFAAPITYAVEGKQYVSMAMGRSLYAFALQE